MCKLISGHAHKGDFAHVAILEGSPGKRGASRLAALAALRAGAGLVTILVDKLDENVPGDRPEFMKAPARSAKPENYSILVIGPGLEGTVKIKQALSLFKKALVHGLPIVLDAGALPLLTQLTNVSRSKSIIFATPHPGEAGRLLGLSPVQVQQNRQAAMTKLIALSHEAPARVIWVLKGANTIIAECANAQYVSKGEVPSLAVGGSGDVLSGTIAGLWGRTENAYECALVAVNAHLQAGRKLAAKAQRGHLASEIANKLPEAINDLSEPCPR